MLSGDKFDRNEVTGVTMFVFVGIALATTSLIQGREGKGISIAAIVVGIFAVLGALGSL